MVPALKTNSHRPSWGDDARRPGSPVSIDRFYIAIPPPTRLRPSTRPWRRGSTSLDARRLHLDEPAPGHPPGRDRPRPRPADAHSDERERHPRRRRRGRRDLGRGSSSRRAPTSSPILLQVGTTGSSADHSQAPTALFDVHCRIGGADAGTAAICVTDRTATTCSSTTVALAGRPRRGAVVDREYEQQRAHRERHDVTAYGLFVEHHQQYQTLWNGNGGAVYFYQSELPYDPPNQARLEESAGRERVCLVQGRRRRHDPSRREGLGVYASSTTPSQAANAIETPSRVPGSSMHHMVTVSFAAGAIDNIINGTGGTVAQGGTWWRKRRTDRRVK